MVRSLQLENSASKKIVLEKKEKPPDYLLLHKNLIASKSQETFSELDNFIAKEKSAANDYFIVNKNSAKAPFDHSTFVSKHPVSTPIVTDHLIGGNIESIFNSGKTEISLDNDETDVEYSGYSILGSGDGSDMHIDVEDVTHERDELKHSSVQKWNHFTKASLFFIPKRVHRDQHSSETPLLIGSYDRSPLARDDRFITSARYPKDRGKMAGRIVTKKSSKMYIRKHSKVSLVHDIAEWKLSEN